ncbi:MAG: hypothetical protein KY463_14110, partial [Actinobacteria bacterium]|nr:hypothetical protein [Actinomycetota bacterium]
MPFFSTSASEIAASRVGPLPFFFSLGSDAEAPRACGSSAASELASAADAALYDELAELVADGLLPASNARPRLTAIAERLAKLEAESTPARLDPQVLVHPRQVWESWSMPQRREALRVLLDKVTLRHVGPGGGPRADPTRVRII